MSIVNKGPAAILKYLRDQTPLERKKAIKIQEELKEDIHF